MKKIIAIFAIIATFGFVACNNTAETTENEDPKSTKKAEWFDNCDGLETSRYKASLKLESKVDSLSYALGSLIGADLKNSGFEEFNYDVMNAAMQLALNGDSLLMDKMKASSVLQAFAMKQMKEKSVKNEETYNTVGDYYHQVSRNMGGFQISSNTKLSIKRNGPGDYDYSISQTIIDQMYGGQPKTDFSSGKLDGAIQEGKWKFISGNYADRGAYIVVPLDGWENNIPIEINVNFAIGRGELMTFMKSNKNYNSDKSSNYKKPSTNAKICPVCYKDFYHSGYRNIGTRTYCSEKCYVIGGAQ